MSISHRKRVGFDRSWMPTDEQVEAAVRNFFTCTDDDFLVVRTKVVGLAVAASLGAVWSPALGTMVRGALERMGAEIVLFNHVHLAKRVQPRHFDRAEALALSVQLRGRKNPPANDGQV